MGKLTDFGYQKIPVEEKVSRVREVFTSVADKYDVMNDLMSFGIHRLWKKTTIHLSHVKSGQIILDIAGGTGDLTRQFAQKVGPKGRVVLADINGAMLNKGRDNMIDAGITQNVNYVQANAECLPFPENTFNCVSIAFGLRNVTDKPAALRNFYNILQPGGQLLVLEFSKPNNKSLQSIYDAYSFKALPKLGEIIANDAASYQYLAESIRMHPDQETLKTMILDAGFDTCEYLNFSGGIVALHKAYKY